jgi:hypothetical protein
MMQRDAEELLQSLKTKSRTLEELHDWVRASGSAWSVEQLQLFLMCAPGVQYDKVSGMYRVETDDREEEIQRAIVEAVRSFEGRPVPAVQVRARLPNHLITTDEQILAIARRNGELEVFGPNLIRITKK